MKLTFVSLTTPAAASSHLPRHADSGKVNPGNVEDEFQSWKAYSSVMSMDVEDSVADAIQSCVDEGCSVEAMMTLDTILAEKEKMVMSTKSEKADDKAAIAWLDNFLSKTVSLRSQLLAAKPAMPSLGKDSDFLKQMIKAAGIAFGATPRGNDYPKIGVSSYSA